MPTSITTPPHDLPTSRLLPAADQTASGIPPEYHAGVANQLAALLTQARLVEEFALPPELAPAPVFVP